MSWALSPYVADTRAITRVSLKTQLERLNTPPLYLSTVRFYSDNTSSFDLWVLVLFISFHIFGCKYHFLTLTLPPPMLYQLSSLWSKKLFCKDVNIKTFISIASTSPHFTILIWWRKRQRRRYNGGQLYDLKRRFTTQDWVATQWIAHPSTIDLEWNQHPWHVGSIKHAQFWVHSRWTSWQLHVFGNQSSWTCRVLSWAEYQRLIFIYNGFCNFKF